MLRKHPFIIGQYYHVYNRGVDKRIIFNNKYDYERFLMLLHLSNSSKPFVIEQLLNLQNMEYVDIFKIDRGNILVSIGSWCLMPNHFHLLLREEVENGISQFMKKLATGYAMYFNLKNERSGSLFQGPFKSKYIGNDNYMRKLFSYIHLNPLEIKYPSWKENIKQDKINSKKFLSLYRYSSYLDYLGYERIEGNLINQNEFPKYFSNTKDFQDFVEGFTKINEDIII
ncbi:MAG: Transposase [Candidatus Nomurabacteria bacterium GW2011_GWB1_37_5]|uniref:Transposase n=1 Tax=Candidatus Nomurabacteria bacterium GW2011_GWB1_37_5 TaxID=1618742 RepID=A0A0G0GX62_9BACT|nr:MAG: Transposase [Candidatus Nomurabacteria bacterium GW2011_GWB1_37_5]